MTLSELRKAHPDKFNMTQTWFEGEAFMDSLALNPDGLEFHGITIVTSPYVPDYNDADEYPTAVHLAALFLRWPDDLIWERYIWTRDKDSHGQRIYVGVNNGLFEIHRHLHLTSRWAIAECH